jgi:hypothetical protein
MINTHLTQDPCFSTSAERLLALEPGFQCGQAERGANLRLFFRTLFSSRFRPFSGFFVRESEKSGGVHRWLNQELVN